MINQDDAQLLKRIIHEWQGQQISQNCSRDFHMEEQIEKLQQKLTEVETTTYGATANYNMPANYNQRPCLPSPYGPQKKSPYPANKERFGF